MFIRQICIVIPSFPTVSPEAEFNEKELFPGKRELKSCHLCLIAGSPHIRVQPCWNERYAYIGNAGKHWDKIRFDENEDPFVRIYSPEGINEATFTFLDSDRYLRITVKDAQGRFADTNACFLDTAHFPKKA